MTLTLDAQAQPTNDPPRVLLTITEDDPLNSLQDVVLYRDGVRLRFDPVISGQTAIAYDFDAPFDVPLVYRADADELNTEPEWTETWASLASWFSPPGASAATGWAVAAGAVSSTAPDAIIYRDLATPLTSMTVTVPSNHTLQLMDKTTGAVLGYVKVTPDGKVTLAGSGAASVVVGSGDYTLTVAAFSVSIEGTGWSTQATFAGEVTRIGLKAPGTMTFAAKYGTAGSGAGQFSGPTGIAFDSAGNFFVVDTNRKKILKFNSSGVFQSEFGTAGSGSGQLSLPHSIAIDGSDNMFVTDYGNHKVLKYNSAGVFQSQFGTAGTSNGQFDGPRGIALDSSANIFVADFWNNRVQKFNSAGTYQSQFGTFGTGNGQFDGPHGIAIDSSNNIWVTDWDNNRVQKFNSAGTYQSKFGSADTAPGKTDGKFTNPHSIAIDSGGNVYVTDGFGYRVQRFTSAGVFAAKVGTNGAGDGQFKFPSGIAVRSSGDVYVADGGTNNRVQKFSQAAGSVDDITVQGSGLLVTASATDTETLSPTGDQAGAWLTNAAQPDLALLIEEDDCGGEPYYLTTDTRADTTLEPNTVQHAIEGSAEIVTVAVGPRRRETWTLEIGCTTEVARKALLALLADSAAINLRLPAALNYLGLDGGFYAVGTVTTRRESGPAIDELCIVSLPLTPSKAPAYKALWQWSWNTVAQMHTSWDEVNATYDSWDALLVGPTS